MQEKLVKTAESTKADFNAFERNDLKLREVLVFDFIDKAAMLRLQRLFLSCSCCRIQIRLGFETPKTRK